nr:hypothetical protein [uncultured Roseateles sp.]
MLSRKETRTFVSLAAKAVIVCAGARLLIDILSDALPSHGDWISKGLSILAVVAVGFLAFPKFVDAVHARKAADKDHR